MHVCLQSRGQKPLSLFSSHGQWKLRDFFLPFQPFFRFAIYQTACVQSRIIWKCAIAHWNHVVFFPFLSILETWSFVFSLSRASFFCHRWRLNYTTLMIFKQIWNFPWNFSGQREKKVIKLSIFSFFPSLSSTFPFCINLEQPKCFLFPQVFFPVRFLFTLKYKKGADAT